MKISVLVHVKIDAGCDAIILKASNKYFYFTALELPFTIHVYCVHFRKSNVSDYFRRILIFQENRITLCAPGIGLARN